MNTPSPQIKQTRTRASSKAIVAALEAVQLVGLTVEKVLVHGGKVEIITQPVDANAEKSNPDGPKPWS